MDISNTIGEIYLQYSIFTKPLITFYLTTMSTTYLRTSYIDASDLVDVLQHYYDGTLDNVDEYLPNLYQDLRDLHPTNSLFGQVTSNDIQIIINKLTKLERVCLRYIINRSLPAYNYLQSEYLLNKAGKEVDLDKWIWRLYFDTKDKIGDELLKII